MKLKEHEALAKACKSMTNATVHGAYVEAVALLAEASVLINAGRSGMRMLQGEAHKSPFLHDADAFLARLDGKP